MVSQVPFFFNSYLMILSILCLHSRYQLKKKLNYAMGEEEERDNYSLIKKKNTIFHIMHNDRKGNKGNNRPITFLSEQMFAVFRFIPELQDFFYSLYE